MTDRNVRVRRRLNMETTAEELAQSDLHVHSGFILVQRVAYGNETEEKETIQVPLFHTDPARVRVSGGATRNLGNYSSARADVTIELPCYPEMSEVRRVYDMITRLIDEWLPVELQKGGVPLEESQ